MGIVARIDDQQRAHRWLAFPFAVYKKFSDDQSGNLAVLITYYAFFSIFPLLIALASSQVDRSVVRMFRASRSDDSTLVELAAWASLSAARRVGTWIPQASPEADRDSGTAGTHRAGT